MKEQTVGYYSTRQAAAKLGCSEKTISRAARRSGIGIYFIGGRLAALAPTDLTALRSVIHETSGNPNWIAAGQAAKKRRRKNP